MKKVFIFARGISERTFVLSDNEDSAKQFIKDNIPEICILIGSTKKCYSSIEEYENEFK